MWKPEREKDEDGGRNRQGEGWGEGETQQPVGTVGVEGTVALWVNKNLSWVAPQLCAGHWRDREKHLAPPSGA